MLLSHSLSVSLSLSLSLSLWRVWLSISRPTGTLGWLKQKCPLIHYGTMIPKDDYWVSAFSPFLSPRGHEAQGLYAPLLSSGKHETSLGAKSACSARRSYWPGSSSRRQLLDVGLEGSESFPQIFKNS